MTVAANLDSPRVQVFTLVNALNAGDGSVLFYLIPGTNFFTQLLLDYFFAHKNYLSQQDWTNGTAGLTLSSAAFGLGVTGGQLRGNWSLSTVSPANYPAGTVFSVASSLG